MAITRGTATAFTITNLHSNTSSATNIWLSNKITANANAIDALFSIKLAFANTSPANSKAAFVYALGSLDDTDFTNPWAGTEGDGTVVDFTTNAIRPRCIGTIPYTTADEDPVGRIMNWGGAQKLWLPPYFGIGIMLHTSAALSASGSVVKYQEIIAG